MLHTVQEPNKSLFSQVVYTEYETITMEVGIPFPLRQFPHSSLHAPVRFMQNMLEQQINLHQFNNGQYKSTENPVRILYDQFSPSSEQAYTAITPLFARGSNSKLGRDKGFKQSSSMKYQDTRSHLSPISMESFLLPVEVKQSRYRP
jgi:hypothetical protein